MEFRRGLAYLPGFVGWLLVTVVTLRVAVWSVPGVLMLTDEDPAFLPWASLIPLLVVTVLALIPVRWPWGGGWFLGAMGAVLLFTPMPWQQALLLVLTAVLFALEGRRQSSLPASGTEGASWVDRHLPCSRRTWLTLALTALAFLVRAALLLPSKT